MPKDVKWYIFIVRYAVLLTAQYKYENGLPLNGNDVPKLQIKKKSAHRNERTSNNHNRPSYILNILLATSHTVATIKAFVTGATSDGNVTTGVTGGCITLHAFRCSINCR